MDNLRFVLFVLFVWLSFELWQAWQVDYLAFEDDVPDALPTRLFLQHGDLEIRLAIDTWTLEKP